METEPRDFTFTTPIEVRLVELSHQTKTNLNSIRSRYRHAVVASGMTSSDALNYISSAVYLEPVGIPEVPEEVRLLSIDECVSPEHAVTMLAEYSGMGYEAIPAFRATWIRAVQQGQDPYQRTLELASRTYDSPDADLLPYQIGGM